tara:strand:- start:31 stop:321 length:291 start_codon:yes stop_codon:yes gene_type:complete
MSFYINGYSIVEGCIKQSSNIPLKQNNDMNELHDEWAEMILYKTFLQNEINVLESRFKPHDTGHIKSAAGTLRARLKELDRRIENNPDWKDEYLLG